MMAHSGAQLFKPSQGRTWGGSCPQLVLCQARNVQKVGLFISHLPLPTPAQPSGQICVQFRERKLGGNEGPLLSWAESQWGALPQSPTARAGKALLRKAVEGRVPIEQMEKLRFLLGRVPSHPESYLRPFLGQVDCQPQTSPQLPQHVWKLFYRLPGMQGLLGRDVGRDRFACGCKCFPCKHGLCQSVLSHMGSEAAT